MRKQKWILMAAAAVTLMLFTAAGLYAEGCNVPDVFKMEDPCYKGSHKKGIVEFTHKKHMTDYKIGCGDCHHNKDGKPLTDLKEGDCVEKCSACHKKPGEMPKDEAKAIKKLPKKEQLAKELEYQAEAVHMNCRDCHKAYNKKNKLKSKDPGYAPTSCTQCHPKG